uniref:DUF4054 domain-containing protein n=4 Tax=unclassified bacterial viruses TaxID=12333 RepID=A0AAU6W2Z1_9VIRU
MTIATFDPVAFKVRYPEFASVSDELLAMYFEEAGLYLSNTDASPVQNVARRTMLLWMLTAHIAYLNGAGQPEGSVTPGGRVSSATEGSVSVGFDLFPATGTSAWFNFTPYGAAYYQATLSLRSFRYRPRPTRY